MSANQTTGFSDGDPVKFNTVDTSNGSDISLNTSTWIFTLKAGKTYSLESGVRIQGSAAIFGYQWYNITNSTFIGTIGFSQTADSSNNSEQQTAKAYITPSTDITVKLYIIGSLVSNISAVDYRFSYAQIEAVEQVIPVGVGVSASRIRRRGGTTRGSSNTNVIIYATAEELNGTSLTYSNDATNGDSFIVNTSGVYAVSLTAESTTNDGTLIICVGSTIVNSPVGTSSLRTFLDVSGNRCSIAWTGYVEAGQKIWAAFSTTTLNSNSYDNQISIAGPL
jgi:hypothetical protein